MRKSPHMRSYLIISSLLVILTLASYWQVFNFDFVEYDDKDYIIDNLYVKTGLTAANAAWAFTTDHAANWHPLTWLSHMLDCQIFGLNPMGHHLTNLIFHILNTLLLFYILSRMTKLPWRSGFVAALFAIHPLHIQSVAWVAERKDVLSTFFFLLTILAYIRYAEQTNLKRYTLVLLAFALGLMAKPMLVTLPLILLLLDYWPLNRYAVNQNEQAPTRKDLFWNFVKEKAPLLIIVVISYIITFIVQRKGGAVNQLDVVPIGVRIANSFVSYIAYIHNMIWPQDLCVLYPHPLHTIPVWQVITSVLLFSGITYFAVRIARKSPYFTVGWLWYVITLIPVIGLIQVGEQAMADRYTYIPLIGLFIAIAWAISDMLKKRLERNARGNAILALPAIVLILILSVRKSGRRNIKFQKCNKYQLLLYIKSHTPRHSSLSQRRLRRVMARNTHSPKTWRRSPQTSSISIAKNARTKRITLSKFSRYYITNYTGNNGIMTHIKPLILLQNE